MSKNDQKSALFWTRSWEVSGTPKSLQKWSEHCPKSSQIGSKLSCFSLVASSVFHYTFSRFSEIERASRSFAKTGSFLDVFMALFFEVVFKAAFWPQIFYFFELKLDFDLFLEASWDPLGTILGDFWSIFGNFLGTCLASRFDIDVSCFSMRLNLDFLILVEARIKNQGLEGIEKA